MPLDEAILERMLGYEWRERLPPICPECGYNLTGLPDNRCPECGYVYSRSDVKRNAQTMICMLQQLKDVNDILKVGFYLGIGAAVLLAATVLTPYGLVGRIVAVFAGLPTIGLGLQVFRVRQVPAWAREFLSVNPHYGRGVFVCLLGVLLIITALLLP
ncbi:MAG: hypothetical protein JSV19_11035 [Phycisphaerales bacterium]|nr:MAG: hypothetical protein JSV19_11035 [Phycisphaerales bacterium]